MYNIIALMGEAGSGKDRTMQAVLAAAPSAHEIISCTTRPIRDGEAHGVNYYYYTPEEFEEKIANEEMIEYTIFNNWYYGTGYESLVKNAVNIGVFNPDGVRSLLARSDCNVLIFKINANDKIRLLRQLNREKNPDVREVVRRFQADYKDFDNLDKEFFYRDLNNETEEDLRQNVKTIVGWIECANIQGQE